MKIKSFLLIIALVTGIFACFRNKTEKLTVRKNQTHKEAMDTLQVAAADEGNYVQKPLEFMQIPSDSIQKLLSKYDLASLFKNYEGNYHSPSNGFYGKSNYRIEMYFSEVTKDSINPFVYHLKGKSRFKKNIIPFEGTFTVDSVSTFKDPNLDSEAMEGWGLNQPIMIGGNFVLNEDKSKDGSGVYSGRFSMDFGILKEGGLELWYYSQGTQTQGAGYKFEGEWASYKSGKTNNVLWAADLFMIANNVLKDFSIGERDVEINKKYVHLGWQNFWENEEWWTESKKEVL